MKSRGKHKRPIGDIPLEEPNLHLEELTSAKLLFKLFVFVLFIALKKRIPSKICI